MIFQLLNFIMAGRAFAKNTPTLQASRPHIRESKILDTTPRIPDPRAGFVIFCQWKSAILRGIPDSFELYPGIHSPPFLIPQAKFLGFQIERTRIRIPLHGTTSILNDLKLL